MGPFSSLAFLQPTTVDKEPLSFANLKFLFHYSQKYKKRDINSQ